MEYCSNLKAANIQSKPLAWRRRWGEVYEVDCNRSFALKWYKHTATLSQKNILENLITKGRPDSTFLWPMDMILPAK